MSDLVTEDRLADELMKVIAIFDAVRLRNEGLMQDVADEIASLKVIVASSIVLMSGSPELLAILRAKALDFDHSAMTDERRREIKVRIEKLLANEVPGSISWQ